MVEFKKTNERGNGRFWKMIDLYTCCLLSSIAMRFKSSNHYKNDAKFIR